MQNITRSSFFQWNTPLIEKYVWNTFHIIKIIKTAPIIIFNKIAIPSSTIIVNLDRAFFCEIHSAKQAHFYLVGISHLPNK